MRFHLPICAALLALTPSCGNGDTTCSADDAACGTADAACGTPDVGCGASDATCPSPDTHCPAAADFGSTVCDVGCLPGCDEVIAPDALTFPDSPAPPDNTSCGPDGCGEQGKCIDGYCYNCAEEGWCNAIICESDGNPCTLEVLDGATGDCNSVPNTDCQAVMRDLARIYRGAQAYYANWEPNEDGFAPPELPVGKVYPLSQGLTPVEETCCVAFGGPDADANNYCDSHPMIWDMQVWNILNFRKTGEHRYNYAFDETGDGKIGEKLFTISAVGDLDCDQKKGTFSISGRFTAECAGDKYYNCLDVPKTIRYVPETGPAHATTSPSHVPHLGSQCWTGQGGYACGFRIIFEDTLAVRFREPIRYLLQAYRGANRYFSVPRAQTTAPGCLVPPGTAAALDAHGDAFPTYLPLSQGITPVEGTCCGSLGGPDVTGDDLCDPCFGCFSEPAWANMGINIIESHRYVLAVQESPLQDDSLELRFEARGNPYCKWFKERLVLAATVQDDGGNCKVEREEYMAYLPHEGGSDYDPPLAIPIRLRENTLGPFGVPHDLYSPDKLLNAETFEHEFLEPVTNLQAIADGISAYVADDCVLPFYPGPTPVEGTCCGVNGGPDADKNGSCDAGATSWDHPFWQAIGFSIPGPHYYVYSVVPTELDEQSALLTIRARGDRNCQGPPSRIERFGILTQAAPAECTIQWLEGYNIENLFE